MVGHVVCCQLPARSLAHAVVALQLHVIVQYPTVLVHGYAVDYWVAMPPVAHSKDSPVVLIKGLPCCS